MVKADAKLHLTLSGAGISVDREVPEAVAAELMRLVLRGEPTAGGGQLGEAPRLAHQVPEHGSLADLFQSHEPKRNPDKIAVIAFHLRTSGHATFTKDEVRSGFRRAGEQEPGNFARDWNWAVHNGWIDGNATDGFYLTNTGQKVVRGNFARDLVERTRLRAGRKARRTRPKS